MATQETVQEAALKALEAEEATARDSRLRNLEAEEERRREEERYRREQEERRAAARVEAENLAARRGDLLRSVEERTGALVAAIGELETLDGEHRRKLAEAGGSVPSEPVRALLSGWLAGVPGLPVEGLDPWSYSGRNPRLLDRDPLAPKGPPPSGDE